MKKFALFLTFFTSLHLLGQINESPTNYLANNTISKFTSHFSETIDLTIPGAQGNYSNNQAEILIENFFKQNTLKNYTVQHVGGGNGRPQYEIGQLITEKGKYRTYLLVSKVLDKSKIIEFRVEKD